MEIIKHSFTVGDEVSYGFNGDCYYAGKVAKITKKFLTTDQGNKFSLTVKELWTRINEHEYADVPTEVFRSIGGGTWTLVKGRIEKQNPHF